MNRIVLWNLGWLICLFYCLCRFCYGFERWISLIWWCLLRCVLVWMVGWLCCWDVCFDVCLGVVLDVYIFVNWLVCWVFGLNTVFLFDFFEGCLWLLVVIWWLLIAYRCWRWIKCCIGYFALARIMSCLFGLLCYWLADCFLWIYRSVAHHSPFIEIKIADLVCLFD